MTAAILTEQLSKHYGEVEALSGLDLEIPLGEVFGFLGPNGAGKTTMIRTILDEIRPTSGRASILGLDSRRASVEIRRHIGYLPGDLTLYPKLTARDTLTYFANLRGGVEWAYVEELAERLGANLSGKVGDMSTGNRQKVGLIQAFMNRPEVLILDEPSAGLDPLVQREFQAMMRAAADQGRTVFLSSHTLSEVQRVADRVGIIRNGRLIALEAVRDLRDKALRRIELEFAAPVPESLFAGVPGVHMVDLDGPVARISFDGRLEPLLQAARSEELLDVSTEDADLEEVFLTYYRDRAQP